MIHPQLATMLAVLTTDYPLEPGEAIDFLRPAVERSFNSISVDGECSTNDAVCLLANGASRIERTPASDTAFALALGRVCGELAEQIVADGEGATVLAEIEVTGAVDGAQARAIARRIATSPLVKTALFGHDANWGRVLAAAGSAPHNGGFAAVESARVTLSYNGTMVLERGAPLRRRAGRLERHLPDRARPRPRHGRGELPDDRPLLRLRPHQRGLPHMSLDRRQGRRRRRGGVRDARARPGPEHDVCVVHGAGPQISAEMERSASRCASSSGRRVTSADALAVVRRLARRRQRRNLRGDRSARGAPLRRRDRTRRGAGARARARRLAASLAPAGDRGGSRRRADPGRRAARRSAR